MSILHYEDDLPNNSVANIAFQTTHNLHGKCNFYLYWTQNWRRFLSQSKFTCSVPSHYMLDCFRAVFWRNFGFRVERNSYLLWFRFNTIQEKPNRKAKTTRYKSWPVVRVFSCLAFIAPFLSPRSSTNFSNITNSNNTLILLRLTCTKFKGTNLQ